MFLDGSKLFPDQHGLANVENSLNPAPTQTVFLTSAAKAPSYGRATNVVAFYMIQQQYAKRMELPPNEVDVLASPFDIEDILFKHFCLPLKIESRMTLRRLVDPDLTDVPIVVDGSFVNSRDRADQTDQISPAQPVTYLDEHGDPINEYIRWR